MPKLESNEYKETSRVQLVTGAFYVTSTAAIRTGSSAKY